MSSVSAAVRHVHWPKDSQKFDIYINEKGMYELLLSSQQSKAKEFRKHCCNVILPHVRQQRTNKMKEDHQKAMKEKDAALALLIDDLQDRDNQIQVIQYENLVLQAQRDAYQTQLQRCQDTITHLRTRYVDHARDPSKYNIIIIARKHTRPASDKYNDLPYYVARIQRRKRYIKLRWFN